MHIEKTAAGCRLRIEGEMTVSSAADIRDEILAALPATSRDEVEVDLSGVSEIDTAGLQIMLQLKRRCGTRLRLVNHSPAVIEILDMSNLGAQFGDPLVIPSGECPPSQA
ncbi:MAG: anti-sigma B factor antagonist [Rhodocyclaceae bacterium]|nr:anti-sigma B factor antagonist [Rhodocyclaceae bacterium]